ncbi:methyl-CpG-binding domain protein 4-like isoform X2 [Hetaerina americana]|uniref:methyl-CpG-binding domain protein 4-like isoform X2 n=1 Tax=Hetaerina americana TaxID=62018 RepID=UPI003A7F3214
MSVINQCPEKKNEEIAITQDVPVLADIERICWRQNSDSEYSKYFSPCSVKEELCTEFKSLISRKTVKSSAAAARKSIYFRNSRQSGPMLKLSNEIPWTPPKSPYNLIQETLFSHPWKLLVAAIFLNKTSGRNAVPMVLKFLNAWSTPEDVLQADVNTIENMIRPLGLQKKRAQTIIKFSGMSMVTFPALLP